MKPVRCVIIIVGLIFILASCSKEKLSDVQCNDLKTGLVAEDEAMIRGALADFLTRYSKTNIRQLADAVTDNCDIDASFDCYSCIKTNPPMTEMTFSFVHQGTAVTKTVDIGSDSNNKMIIVNVH